MRFLLMTGLIIGGAAAVLYTMRDKPMVRQRAEQAKKTASEVGGVVTHAASDIKDTAAHAVRDEPKAA